MINPSEKEDEELDVLDIDGHKVILWNDDYNTFDWVISCLVEVCGHTTRQAEQNAILVHHVGKSIVKEGDLTSMRKIKNKLQVRGLTVSLD